MATATLSQFRNEPVADFSQPANRQAMEAALKKVRSEFGREYPLRIGHESISTGDKLPSVNPSNPGAVDPTPTGDNPPPVNPPNPAEVVGVHPRSTTSLANRAVDSAYAAFPQWAATP